jgi:three-Cys-motif partner protein
MANTTGPRHDFGGEWTTRKLDIIAGYLSAYTTALKDKPSPVRRFHLWYIDAFAGTGYVDLGLEAGTLESQFPDFTEEERAVLDGSARRALQIVPPFDRYIFIERNRRRCEALELLGHEFPHHAAKIQVQQGEANAAIQELCRRAWKSHRAVLFLDPYGMQVDWNTIEAIAATEAIDMWLLFPLGIGVNRLTPKTGNVPIEWRRKLDQLLGTTDWYEAFYRYEAKQLDMFGGDGVDLVEKSSVETIGKYFLDRLRSVFPAVASRPRVLSNSRNCPLYLLCFAAGNAKGAPIALRIADHLLTKW